MFDYRAIMTLVTFCFGLAFGWLLSEAFSWPLLVLALFTEVALVDQHKKRFICK